MRYYSRTFLRTHAVIAMALGLSMAILATLGHLAGLGPLAVLQGEILGYLGLLQAYLIFAIVGLSMWGASNRTIELGLWHLCGLLAHFPAFVLTVSYWTWMQSQEIFTGTVFLHGFFIVAEAAFAFSYAQNRENLA